MKTLLTGYLVFKKIASFSHIGHLNEPVMSFLKWLFYWFNISQVNKSLVVGLRCKAYFITWIRNTFISLQVLILEIYLCKASKVTLFDARSMSYLIISMKSFYVLLNKGAHKNVYYRDGWNDQKIYTMICQKLASLFLTC
jgi:hypothetical protein